MRRPRPALTLANAALRALAGSSPLADISSGMTPRSAEDVVDGIATSEPLRLELLVRVRDWIATRSPTEARAAALRDIYSAFPSDHWRRQELFRRFLILWEHEHPRPTLVAILEDDPLLEKGAGHKYLSRVPTGKVTKTGKIRYRYIYKWPGQKHLVSDDSLKVGSKIKVAHQGVEGHFEVHGHDKAKDIVHLKHDESGKLAHVKVADLRKMVDRYHEGKGTGAPGKKVQLAPVPESGLGRDLPVVKMDKIHEYHNVVKGCDTADEARALAKIEEAKGNECAVVPQPDGYLLVSRQKTSGKPGEGGDAEIVLRGAGGTENLSGKWVVVEADSLIASHDPHANFQKRSDYPTDVQERPYHSSRNEQEKVRTMSRDLNPSVVVNNSPTAADGAPIVTEKGVVLGGNGRTMAMQLAYRDEPKTAAKLKAHLSSHAHHFGIQKSDVEKMKSPVLVRRVEVAGDTDKLRYLGRRMNENLTQGLDPRTEEVALAKNYVRPEVVADLVAGMEPEEDLHNFLADNRSLDFVNSIRRAGLIDARNAPQFIDEDTGLLNEEGRAKVERVLAARIIPDAELLGTMLPTVRANIAAVVPHLMRAEATGWGINKSLETAIRADQAWRSTPPAKRLSRSKFLKDLPLSEKGKDMDATDPQTKLRDDKIAQKLFGLIGDYLNKSTNSSKWASGLREYAGRAEAASEAKREEDTYGGGLLGGGHREKAETTEETAKVREDTFDEAFGVTPEARQRVVERKTAAEKKAAEENARLLANVGLTFTGERRQEAEAPPAQDEQTGSLFASMRDDLMKADGKKGSNSYAVNRIIRELKHLCSGKADKALIKSRLGEWMSYALDHDPEMRKAAGSLTAQTLDGLIDAVSRVHALEKSFAKKPPARAKAKAKPKAKLAVKKPAAPKLAVKKPAKPAAPAKPASKPKAKLTVKPKPKAFDVGSHVAEKLDRTVAGKQAKQGSSDMGEIGKGAGGASTSLAALLKDIAPDAQVVTKNPNHAEKKIRTEHLGDASKLTDAVSASALFDKPADIYDALDKLQGSKEMEIVSYRDRMRGKAGPGGHRDVLLKVKVGGHVAQLHLGLKTMAVDGADKMHGRMQEIAKKAGGEKRDLSSEEALEVAHLAQTHREAHDKAWEKVGR